VWLKQWSTYFGEALTSNPIPTKNKVKEFLNGYLLGGKPRKVGREGQRTIAIFYKPLSAI
jgi:hypothetical protein